MRVLIAILMLVLGCNSGPGSNITVLDLSNQKLSAIPDSVFSLTQLEHLQLGNRFTLYPPLSALGPDNVSVDSFNKFDEIPNDIGKLRHLQVLGLCFTDLRALPKELEKLEKLDTLDLSFNEHLSIAAELKTLKKLRWLKYLNIIATKSDKTSIDKLRKWLPTTRIDAEPEVLNIETP